MKILQLYFTIYVSESYINSKNLLEPVQMIVL